MLSCTFISCGSKNDSSSSSESSVEESSESSEISEESSESSEESSEESSGSEAASSIDGFEFGTVENGIYTSSFNGMSFTAPEGFEFSSEEEILSMLDIGTDIIGGDNADLYKELASKTTIYDMMAQNASTGESVIIMYENLTAYGYDVDDFTIDDYVTAMESQFSLAASSGVNYESAGSGTATLCGKEFKRYDYNCEMTSYNYSTTQSYYLSLENGLITGIIVSKGISENEAPFYEACFSEYTA